jgi:polyisoprenoid-binding protein YceI
MLKKIVAIGLVALTALTILAGVLAYGYLKPAAAASGPIQAIPVAQASSAGASAASTVYTIDQASSQARFTIDEVLNGSPKTVVGSTDQVAGQIAVTPTAPGTAQVGTIQIDVRTLTTDSDQRNRAIQNMILKTDQYEYVTFVPTAVVGLPESATVGQSYSFQIVGQLTVAGQTHEATFDVTAIPTADGRLQGSATTTLKYADWGISIPQVPFVTGVADTVTLALDFVATAN